MRIRFVLSQGIRMLIGNPLQTMLLILCYSCGILIPFSIFSYRQGVLDVRLSSANAASYSHDYIAFQEGMAGSPEITSEVFKRLTDYDEISNFLSSIGPGIQLSFLSMEFSESAILINGNVIRGRINWRLPADEAGRVYDIIRDNQNGYIGSPLEPDEPFSIMLGGNALRGLGDPQSFIGREAFIYGVPYVIKGVITGSDISVGNLLSQSFVKSPMIGFRVAEKSSELMKLISNELYDRYRVDGLQEVVYTDTDNYSKEVDKQISDMMVIALIGFCFCIINSFGIINSFLADNSKTTYTKLMVGARRLDILTELIVFWLIIVIAGSILAFGAVFLVKEYFASIFHYKMVVGWESSLLLPLAGLAVVVLASLYSTFATARRLA